MLAVFKGVGRKMDDDIALIKLKTCKQAYVIYFNYEVRGGQGWLLTLLEELRQTFRKNVLHSDKVTTWPLSRDNTAEC